MNGEWLEDDRIGRYHRRSSATFQLAIYLGGDVERARELCRPWVEQHPRCVTVEPLDFVYTGGAEAGVRVKLINYPRFPATPDELWHAARQLALHLMDGLAQQSLSIVATDRTEWISRREQDLVESKPASSIRAFRDSDEAAVIELWRSTGLPQASNDPGRDIERKRTVQPELFLVVERNGKIVGSVMAGYDGHRGWINYLAVDPNLQGQGIGRALVAEVERLLAARGCPKVNLQVRGENTAVLRFYERLGFRVEDRVSFGKRLLSD